MAGLVLSKRTLEAACRLIEDVLVATCEPQQGAVCLAMFQRPVYFGLRERRFARLAGHLAACVVGYSHGGGVVPAGVTPVTFDDDHPLALEWTLVVLGPAAGAALVAVDRCEPAPDEASRRFNVRCTFDRAEAAAQARRLLGQLDVPTDVAAVVRAATTRASTAGPTGDLLVDLVARYEALVVPTAVG